MQCTLSDSSLVEVREVLQDNVHVRITYLDSLDNPEISVGDERQVPFEEIIAEYMGAHAEGLTWGAGIRSSPTAVWGVR